MSQWPLKKSYFWEEVPFFRLLLPLVAGIICYEMLPWRQPALIIVLVLSLICLLGYVATDFIKKQNNIVSIAGFVAIHLFLFSAAWLISYQYDIRNDRHWFGNSLKSAVAFKASITGQPVEKEKTWKVPVSVKAELSGSEATRTTGKAFIYVYKNNTTPPFAEGDEILLPAKLQRIKNAGNPFEFDYAGYAARHNLYYQQFLPANEIVLYKKASSADLPVIKQVHNWCMLQLARYIKDKSTLGLMQAMIVGDEVNMDNETRQAYAETGIIHIVAISGSHITIFFFLISFLLGWIKNKRFQWLKYLLAIPLIWLYVVIAGAPPSAVRAALMFSLLGIGFALQKQHNSLNQLFATAFGLLLMQPYWLFSVGFQLSFLAVLSIVLFYKPLYNIWLPGNKITRALWASIVVSVAAEILVAPLVIYYFHLFPVMFIVANVAAYLFMGVVLVLGMLIIACSWLPPLATFLATLTHWLVSIFNVLVDFFRKLNPDSFRLLDLKTVELVLLYAVILAFGVYLFKRRKPALISGLILMVCLLVSFCYNEWQYLHQQKLIVYNIGRATHVELFRGKTFAILATDTASVTKTKVAYTIKHAHIGLHANEQLVETKPNYLQVGKSKVLLLNGPVTGIPNLTAHYVIINYKPSMGDVAAIKAAHNPRVLVLGNNIPARIKKRILAEAAENHIPVHNVDRDGAFVLDAQ